MRLFFDGDIMKITQLVQKQSLEDVIDKHIEKIKQIQSNGIKSETDVLFLDTCLKYVILTSQIRKEENV
jgi:hypothetical protein